MKSKLTLSVSPQAVRKGKRIARQRNQSLSEMVTAYLEALETARSETPLLDPRIDACLGAYKLPSRLTLDDLRLKSLLRKYGGIR